MQQSIEREISVAFQRLSIALETQKHENEIKELTAQFNNTHMEELLYWIQYKNSLKYKVDCLCGNQSSTFHSIIVQMSEQSDSSNRQ